MKITVKNITFEWTIHQELIITIGKGISMSSVVDDANLDAILKFFKNIKVEETN